MSREEPFTKERRQEIIQDFCRRRNTDFDARLFEKEVREAGKKHPAWAWFQWDDGRAANEHRIWQARQFAIGLRISFTVQIVGREGPVKVREVEAPLLMSPGGGRHAGGGYVLTDLSKPDHMAELCRQAADDLNWWLRRYEGAAAHVGIDVDEIRQQVMLLQEASPPKAAKSARPARAGKPRRLASANQRPAVRPTKGGKVTRARATR